MCEIVRGNFFKPNCIYFYWISFERFKNIKEFKGLFTYFKRLKNVESLKMMHTVPLRFLN